MFNSKWNVDVREVQCPVCKRSKGRMCRDKDGKCVPMSHRERRQEAMRVTLGAMMAPSQKSA
jgi:hypothetical protein